MATDSVSHHPGTELTEQDSKDPLGYGSPSTALYGLAIALISFVLPLIAVVTDRTTEPVTDALNQASHDVHGSSLPAPFSIKGSRQSAR